MDDPRSQRDRPRQRPADEADDHSAGNLVTIQNGRAVTYQNGAYVVADPATVPFEVSGRVVQIAGRSRSIASGPAGT